MYRYDILDSEIVQFGLGNTTYACALLMTSLALCVCGRFNFSFSVILSSLLFIASSSISIWQSSLQRCSCFNCHRNRSKWTVSYLQWEKIKKKQRELVSLLSCCKLVESEKKIPDDAFVSSSKLGLFPRNQVRISKLVNTLMMLNSHSLRSFWESWKRRHNFFEQMLN